MIKTLQKIGVTFCLLSILHGWVSIANAQSAINIKGLIKDSISGKPLDFATISIYKVGEKDKPLRTAATKENGEFNLLNITPGSYTLAISSVGYQQKTKQLQVDAATDMGIILLSPSTKQLAGVVITSSRPPIVYKADKMIVNLDASPSNATANLLEALGKIPGVQVDGNGSITLKGKSGVLIMIDGKETYLSGDELTTLLRSMPASGSDQVEVISNPSSKYDAATTGGIINIKSKKSLKEGFNGSLSLATGIGLYRDSDKKVKTNYYSRNSAFWNYRKDKINIFGNAGYSYSQYFENFNEDRFFINNRQSAGSVNNNSFYKSPSNFYQLRAGMDYTINKNSILGFIANNSYSTKASNGYSIASIFNADGSLNSTMRGNTEGIGSHSFNGNYNINYKLTPDKNSAELTADASYIRNRNIDNSNIQSLFFDPQMLPLSSLLLKENTNYSFDVYVGKIDYTQNIGKWKMETGAKASYTRSNSSQFFLRGGQNGYIVDDSRTNNFLYKENINALYLNFSNKFKKLEVQAGLRAEQTIGNGLQTAGDSSFKRSRVDLFPSVFLTYDVTPNYTMSLNYSRKISRPSFRNLNPFVFVSDSLYSFHGNPFLLPEFSQNIEFNHLFYKKINIGIGYYYLDKIITTYVSNDPVTKVTSTYFENFNTYHEFSISATVPVNPFKWWNVTLFGQWIKNNYTGSANASSINLSSSYFSGSISNIFPISTNYSADAYLSYRTEYLSSLLYIKSPVNYGMGFKRKFLYGNFGFSMSSPFYIPVRNAKADYGNTLFTQKINFVAQTYALSFAYKFGKSTVAAQRSKKNATAEEQNRL